MTADDVLIIDEADSFIFNAPEAFKKLVSNNKCICLTATPDDCDGKGMEKAIVDALGFKRLNPLINSV
jgi:anthranilate/para-aminobenzoate synthase component II